MQNKAESVLCVPTALLRPYLDRNGLITAHMEDITGVIAANFVFLPRAQAEEDPEYRQIIPYAAVLRGGEVFSTRRLKKGGEARLHGLISLGLGGHIDRCDGTGLAALTAGLRRELYEEAGFSAGHSEPVFRGCINDESNAVGRVHLGLFCTVTTEGEVCVREPEKLAGAWLKLRSLPGLSGKMETWSALIIDELMHNVKSM